MRNAGCIGWPEAAIEEPASTLLLVEYVYSNNYLGNGNNGSAICTGPVTTTAFASNIGQDRIDPGRPFHLGGYNYLFADGHAKWLHPEQTVGTGTVDSPKGMWTVTADD